MNFYGLHMQSIPWIRCAKDLNLWTVLVRPMHLTLCSTEGISIQEVISAGYLLYFNATNKTITNSTDAVQLKCSKEPLRTQWIPCFRLLFLHWVAIHTTLPSFLLFLLQNLIILDHVNCLCTFRSLPAPDPRCLSNLSCWKLCGEDLFCTKRGSKTV